MDADCPFCFDDLPATILLFDMPGDLIEEIEPEESLLNRLGKKTVKTQLEALMKSYPKLVYFEGTELHFIRAELILSLKSDKRFADFIFTSFERALKHAGLKVRESTHGTNKVKKWCLDTTTRKPATKRERENDEDSFHL